MKKSDPGKDPKQVGILGEKIARDFLASRGYKILETNFRTPFGEIDIIGGRSGLTVFFEVKTRISEKYGAPLSSITPVKKKHIIKSVEYYLGSDTRKKERIRIDAISIKLNERCELEVLKHIKNAIEKEIKH